MHGRERHHKRETLSCDSFYIDYTACGLPQIYKLSISNYNYLIDLLDNGKYYHRRLVFFCHIVIDR